MGGRVRARILVVWLGVGCTTTFMDDEIVFETGFPTGFDTATDGETGIDSDGCAHVEATIVAIPGPETPGTLQVQEQCGRDTSMGIAIDAAEGVFRTVPPVGLFTLPADQTLQVEVHLETTTPGRYDGQILLEHRGLRDTVQISGEVPEPEGA